MAPRGEDQARAKARAALAGVELAQRSIRAAAAQLAPVRGAERERVHLQRLDAKIGRAWQRLARLFDGRLALNVETPDHLQRPEQQLAAMAGGAR